MITDRLNQDISRTWQRRREATAIGPTAADEAAVHDAEDSEIARRQVIS